MSDDLVKRARKALETATDGPWSDSRPGEENVVHDAYGFPVGYYIARGNRRFIAASRDLVPAMADHIEALQAQLAQANAALDAADELAHVVGVESIISGWSDRIIDAYDAYRKARGQDAD